MRPLPKAAPAVAFAVVAGGIVAAVTAAGPHRTDDHRGGEPGGGDGRLVLVSGRDDHGLLATAWVALHERPNDATAVAQVTDGTLARVVATRGTWLDVRTAEGPPAQGWVDDFYLRGVVHLVGPAPTCQVRLDGQLLAMGEQAVVLDIRGAQVRVRLVRTGRTGWVQRSAVRELPPEHGCAQSASPGPPGASHEHH